MYVYALVRSEMGEGDVVLAIFDEENCISDDDIERLNKSDDYSYSLENYELNEFDIDDEI